MPAQSQNHPEMINCKSEKCEFMVAARKLKQVDRKAELNLGKLEVSFPSLADMCDFRLGKEKSRNTSGYPLAIG